MTPPPRFADWILTRVLPLGKRGESIRGDLREEFHHTPKSSAWYWTQTIRLTLHYLVSAPAQQPLTYPRSHAMFDLHGDLRTAFRMLQRNPGTSALIVATLALAIGTATIGFAFADLALFRGLPVDDNSRVVSFFATDSHGETFRGRVSAPDLLDYRARVTTLEQVAGMRDGRAPLIRNAESQTLSVTFATANLFAAMGQVPFAGRLFRYGDDVAGAERVLVLSHHYWRDELGGRPDAIGRTLQIGREIFTVVGVLSPDMEFGNIAAIDLWLPLQLDAVGARDLRNIRFIGRLRAGVSFDQAAAEMATIGDVLAREQPLTNAGWKIRLVPIDELTGGQGFWIVIALFLLSIGLLIAIATANVSNLVMLRAAGRARELAVRTAMGARSSRLLRQFVIEGLLLSIIAAALSIPTAWAGLQAIGWISPEAIFQQLQIDLHEISFVAMLALICPVMFSLASARLIAKPDLRQVFASQGGRGSTATMNGRSALVIAQVALAVIMLTASSLAARSVRHLYDQPLGMTIDRLLVFGMDFNDAVYPDDAAARAAANATREALASMPGVTRVSEVSALPVLADSAMTAMTIDEQPLPPGEPSPTAVVTGARADAGIALGVSLQSGRWWSEGTESEAVISGAAADRYFGGAERAMGRHLSMQIGQRHVGYQVTGVSADIANTDGMSAPPPRVWIPMSPSTRRMTFLVETQDPPTLAASVRAVAAAVAPAVPVENLRPFTEAMQRARASDYAIIATLAGFAVVALLLAAAGLLGVVSYSVAQRTPEFGTRMALGAPASAVVALVARQSCRLLGFGLSVGIAGGVAVGMAMRRMLYGISPADPTTLIGVSVLLALVTLVATAWPAWRASRIDPVVALRAE